MARRVNPYVAGTPVRGDGGFFGRRDALDWVVQELNNPGTNALVLFGQRRIGKTTVLLRLERTMPAESFLPVYFDLQDQAERPLAQVLAELADTLAEATGLDSPDPDVFDDQGTFFRKRFLPELHHSLGQDRRLVFLMDEFDVVDQVAGPQLSDTSAARALFPFLRRAMKDPRLAFVFAIGRRADDLSLDFNATFKTSLVREIWVLDRESTEALVRQAESNRTLQFTAGAVDRIVDLAGGHPYFTQLLCQRVWERAHTRNSEPQPVIDVPEVEAAVPNTLEAGGQALLWMWNGLSPAERVYAAALAEMAGRGQALPEAEVIQVLAGHAARLRVREVETASRDLEKRRVLARAGESAYRFGIELFRRWVRESKPLYQAKHELDRIEPLAERFYEIGKDFFGNRNWEEAIRYFRDALGAYPNHFGARLHLGEALLELGEVDQAVLELQKANALDETEAKYALARAMARARAPLDLRPLLVDDGSGKVYLGDQEVRLSRLEHALLRSLALRPGQMVTRQELMDRLQDEGFENASLDAAVYRMRKKLGDNARRPAYLETIRGRGYVLHGATYVPG
jgi:tetratricopeptide (TPR) repeat protein